MTYLTLLYEFFLTGLFAVGGGLATIPFLKEMSQNYGWFSGPELTDMIAISESTPGPIGINMATFAGFRAGGILGGILATFALVLPSVIVVCIVSRFLLKFRDSAIVNSVFERIRPASAGLIAGAMFSVLLSALFGGETIIAGLEGFAPIFPAIIMYAVFTAAVFILKKIHPIFFIAAGALLGILFGNYLS